MLLASDFPSVNCEDSVSSLVADCTLSSSVRTPPVKDSRMSNFERPCSRQDPRMYYTRHHCPIRMGHSPWPRVFAVLCP